MARKSPERTKIKYVVIIILSFFARYYYHGKKRLFSYSTKNWQEEVFALPPPNQYGFFPSVETFVSVRQDYFFLHPAKPLPIS